MSLDTLGRGQDLERHDHACMHANIQWNLATAGLRERKPNRPTFAILYMASGSTESRCDLAATIRTSSGVQSWPRISSARGSRRRPSKDGGAEGGKERALGDLAPMVFFCTCAHRKQSHVGGSATAVGNIKQRPHLFSIFDQMSTVNFMELKEHF